VGDVVQDCDLLGWLYGDGDQGAIGAEELVDLLGHGKRIVIGVNVQSLFTCVPV